MKPNVSSSSTFPWRGEERNLSYTWRWWKEGGKREDPWRNGRSRNGDGGQGLGKLRENGRRERKVKLGMFVKMRWLGF